MIALDHEIEFACFVFEDGSPDDCTVAPLPPEERPIVTIAPR